MCELVGHSLGQPVQSLSQQCLKLIVSLQASHQSVRGLGGPGCRQNLCWLEPHQPVRVVLLGGWNQPNRSWLNDVGGGEHKRQSVPAEPWSPVCLRHDSRSPRTQAAATPGVRGGLPPRSAPDSRAHLSPRTPSSRNVGEWGNWRPVRWPKGYGENPPDPGSQSQCSRQQS